MAVRPQQFVSRLALVAVLLYLAYGAPLRAQTQPIQYYYDDLGRLVTMVNQSGNVVTYNYDAVGNILSISRTTVKPGSLAIFAFNPQFGEVGFTVTIRGQGFSATASSDLVKFNGTAATVTSATASTLVTMVPAGATTGPISVTVTTQTATSPTNFVMAASPVITTVFPQSALFNAVIVNSQVTGANFIGATFSFTPAGPTASVASVDPTGTSATMTFTAGTTVGTYALLATDAYGNSGTVATAANRFTVVDPSSTAIGACGLPDVVEATYGLDLLNPNSCLTSTMLPLTGEVASLPFSVFNTASPQGSQSATIEADGIPFSILNTAPLKGSQDATIEADGIFFSVQNNASGERVREKTTPPRASAGSSQSSSDTAGGQAQRPASAGRSKESSVEGRCCHAI